MVILSTFDFCLLLIHPEDRVGMWKAHRLHSQADLGLSAGSAVHDITANKSLSLSPFPSLEPGILFPPAQGHSLSRVKCSTVG